ncbi:hypothetical protein NA57DRAFT_80228 [Rhizodiscina lignyota]|uniref:Zn(2)-C6 fungal-type domain-containing protein n=1 Tax=Rhizodiscina lignyota TaxID=1504668 RepID=A0A9P4M635_9PEZI|nr:hypothetical protein NA57DRAFT_80228 [Rhizodiscina lignyota]
MDQRQRVSKACDACKVRKVKCNGQQPCTQCSHLALRCIYAPKAIAPRKQGRRGGVISKYKETTSGSWSSSDASPVSPANHDRYDCAFFVDLIPDFMTAVYPVQPVMTEQEIHDSIQAMDNDQEAKSFALAFGGCTLNLTRTGVRRTPEVNQTIAFLASESIKARGPVMPNFQSSVRQALTSLFLHNCFMTMRDKDTAFFYMRDAISLIQLLRIDQMNSEDPPLSPPERSRRQRLYWEGFIHERFLAILDYRSVVLPPLQDLPEDDPTIPLSIQEGFNQIIKLFQLLDTEFLQNWLGNQSNLTPAWIERKDRELVGDSEGVPEGYALLTPMQRADLIVTKHWLRTLVWRLAMSNTLLSSQSSKECLSLLFPVRLSNQLRSEVPRISREDIEIHGSGIVQKLFEITDTIADVVIAIPAATVEETTRRVDDFDFLLRFVFTFSNLDHTRRRILEEKHEKIQQMLDRVKSPAPSIASPAGSDNPW